MYFWPFPLVRFPCQNIYFFCFQRNVFFHFFSKNFVFAFQFFLFHFLFLKRQKFVSVGLCCKTFYGRKQSRVILNQKVCSQELFLRAKCPKDLRVGISLACRYLNMVEVTDSYKHSCLLQYETYYDRKKFYSANLTS